MSQLEVVTKASAVESALMMNDLSKLTVNERLSYYNAVCESVGLNPMTQPFAFISLQGKITLYAKRDAADQLRKIHGVSIQIVSRESANGLYTVVAKAKDKTGREDESTGIIPIDGMKGADLANAMLKCETKAKRRVTLSLCGLGILDETELGTVSDVGVTANPQIENPFKTETQAQIAEPAVSEAVETSDLGSFVISFGKHKNKTLAEMDMYELNNYLNWVLDSAKKKGEELKGQVKEFTQAAEAYLCTLEVNKSDEINF